MTNVVMELVNKKIDGLGYVIVVHTTKGGAGKTTTATNLAANLSSKGFSVQAIDIDVQNNTATTCESYFAKYMQPGFGRIKTKSSPIIVDSNSYDKMSNNLVRSLVDKKAKYHNEDSVIKVTAPVELLNELQYLKQENDFVIIDTPGIQNPFINQLVVLSDLTIIPVVPSNYDIQSLTGFVASINNTARQLNVDASQFPLTTLLNMVPKNDSIARELRELLNDNDLPCYNTIIANRKFYREITKTHSPYFKGPKKFTEPCVIEQDELLEEIFYFLNHKSMPETTNINQNIDDETVE
ncbi:TPA: ParA family protein [Acinetobacter baumannii]|uniref:ParA family protein n=1 Tax=Acinetobacter baumannii TaxID=470 RepID=UPI00338DDF80